MAARAKSKTAAKRERLSLRAFATKVGVSHPAVRKAIRSGRLQKSIGRDARGPFVADVGLAQREWAAGASKPTNAGGRPAPGAPAPQPRTGPSLVEAQVRVAGERATALELANRIKRGEVHPVDGCNRERFEIARMLRDRILGVPDRLADLGPVVRARLRAELRQALGDHAAEVERG